MKQKGPLKGIILSIVDDKGPHPVIWHPDFADLSKIHNSAVKSFSIMIGDKSYREKSLYDLTCFGLLPFPDMDAVGLIHFTGVKSEDKTPKSRGEIPTTLTIMFQKSFLNKLCEISPRVHEFLERETKDLWSSLQDEESSSQKLLIIFCRSNLSAISSNPSKIRRSRPIRFSCSNAEYPGRGISCFLKKKSEKRDLLFRAFE